jgi:CxxC-x17-CxxC domain-containing protein
MSEIKCTERGKTTMVPFKPTAGKPVYCHTCFTKSSFKSPEMTNMNFSFDPKQAWARRGDGWQGRKEEKPTAFSRVVTCMRAVRCMASQPYRWVSMSRRRYFDGVECTSCIFRGDTYCWRQCHCNVWKREQF